MISALSKLTSDDLKEMLHIRLRIERYEAELVAIHAQARKRPKPTTAQRGLYTRQPSLTELISRILRKNKKPMSVQEIYEASLLEEYHWRSQDPINALNVKMYTDPTFKKVSPGRFMMRR